MSTTVRRPLVALMALAAALALIVPLYASRADAADSTVYIVHGIPGVAVDVYAGGTDPSNKVLTDFQFGDVTDPLSLPAGDLPVVVVPTGGDPATEAVITQTLTVPSGANLSVIADLSSGAPALTPFVNDVSAVAEGSTRVTVRHAANAPAVNVLVDGTVAIANLAAGSEASAVLPAGTYDFQVQLTDGTPLPALSPGSVTLPLAQNGLIVYATGSVTPIGGTTFPLGLVQQTLDLPVAAATTPTTAPPAAAGVTASPAMTG